MLYDLQLSDQELFQGFIDDSVPEGSIIVVACNDERLSDLSSQVLIWFQSIGSKSVDLIKDGRHPFALIGLAGRTEEVNE